MHFSDLNLNKPLLKAIFEKNYETPTEVQKQTIPFVLAKKDVIASAQTGTGKTAAFALPILQLLFHQQDANKELSDLQDKKNETASSLNEEQQVEAGISPELIRLSVGIENIGFRWSPYQRASGREAQ